MPTTKIDVTGNTHFPLVATVAGYADWRSLWQLNGTLQGKRKNPFLLFHGDRNPKLKHTTSEGKEEIGAAPDVIEVPEKPTKQESGGTDTHHPFSTNTDKVFLRLRVLDDEYVPVKDATWKLILDGMPYPEDGSDGAFEAGGMINVQVRKTAQRGKLSVKWTPPAVDKPKEQQQVIEGTSGPATENTGDTQLIRRNGALCPHFSQGGTAWGGRTLGTGSTISAQGCAITSVAMILKYYGRSVDPGVLDQYLDANNGYDGNSVYWDKAFKCGETSGGPKFSASKKVTSGMEAILDDRIKKNLPTIASVDYGSDTDTSHNHFVVIVGKTKDGYVMNDPATSSGNGAANPSNTANILEKTTRKSGYRLLALRYADTDEATATPPSTPPPTEPPPSTPPVAEKPKEEPATPPAPIVVEFMIEVGKLNPIREEAPDANCFAGVQQRLNNLGFDAGTVDGLDGSTTQGAIRRFQRFARITVNGKPDDATQNKLYEIHDQPGTPTKDKLPDEGGSEAPPSTQPPPSSSPGTSPPSTSPGSGTTQPKWIPVAEGEVGQKEVSGSGHNPRIIEYHATTTYKANTDEVAWCSSFVNWVMKEAGYTGTNSARAIDWAKWGKKLDKPAFGAIAVFKWHQKSSECPTSGSNKCTAPSRCTSTGVCATPLTCGCKCTKGHVGFVVGKSGSSVQLLGGNQGDSVKVSNYNTSRIVAYVVPSDYTVPNEAYNLQPYSAPADEGSYDATR